MIGEKQITCVIPAQAGIWEKPQTAVICLKTAEISQAGFPPARE